MTFIFYLILGGITVPEIPGAFARTESKAKAAGLKRLSEAALTFLSLTNRLTNLDLVNSYT